MVTLLVALAAGTLIGLSLGALGGGGSILTVPVLVYLLHESPAAATTGSLVVVGVTAAIAAVTAHRQDRVLVGRGVVFGAMSIAGAVMGAVAASHVAGDVLMLSFAVLMLTVGAAMVVRTRRPSAAGGDASVPPLDDPIITLWPVFTCACPRAAKLLATATVVGVLTGFLGVGGGFVIVPALLLVLAIPLDRAIGTSLVIIAMTSATALVVRAGAAASPDWVVVGALTIAASVSAVLGARVAARLGTASLSAAFTVLVFAVAVYTAAQSASALI